MKFFVKLFVVVALAIGLMVEIASPLYSKTDAAGAAHDAANAAARDYFNSTSLTSAQAAASSAADVRGATVTKVVVQPDGSITVTVVKHARSYVLHDISPLKNWYNVTASATAPPIRA